MKKQMMMILVVSAGLMFGSCGQKEAEKAATESPVETMEKPATVNTAYAYVCPMNCVNSARMEPGLCSVCGMDLVSNPDYAGAATTDTAAVTATESKGGHDDHEGHNH